MEATDASAPEQAPVIMAAEVPIEFDSCANVRQRAVATDLQVNRPASSFVKWLVNPFTGFTMFHAHAHASFVTC